MELNPNHPVTQEIRDQWHKLAALTLFILGTPELEITAEDIEEFSQALGPGAAVACDARGGKLTLRLVNGAEAARLARHEGGLPV